MPNDHITFQIIINCTKLLYYKALPKFTQIGIFGFKIYHLATLHIHKGQFSCHHFFQITHSDIRIHSVAGMRRQAPVSKALSTNRSGQCLKFTRHQSQQLIHLRGSDVAHWFRSSKINKNWQDLGFNLLSPLLLFHLLLRTATRPHLRQ
jgi:hypothetical protein